MATATLLKFERPPLRRDACAGCLARQDGLFTAMGATAFAEVQAVARHVTLRPNQMLLIEGAPVVSVWILRSGVLRVQRIGADGRRQILALLHPGELIGDDLIGRPGYSLEASTPAEVCGLDRRRFEAWLARDADLRRAVLRGRLDKLEQIRWLTWSLRALRLEERVCAFLLYATKVMPFVPDPEADGILSLDLPRLDIADLMATTLESLSRVTHRLHERGVIEILDPAHFRIPDLAALVAASGMRDLAEVPASGAVAQASRALVKQMPVSRPA